MERVCARWIEWTYECRLRVIYECRLRESQKVCMWIGKIDYM